MLYCKYLVFGYDMSDDGYVTIKRLWLENLWGMCRSMEKWPLNLQIKDNVVHKIRPAVWFSSKACKFKPFDCLEDFISAMQETVYQNPKTHNQAGTWLADLLQSYQKFFGKRLSIPRWSEIEGKYR